MSVDSKKRPAGPAVAANQLRKAARARKCWACNCLGSTLATIDKAIPAEKQSPELLEAMKAARVKVRPPEIECRGCDVCYPAVALNALANVADPEALESAICPARDVAPRDGWPPLAGNYTVLGYHLPVAVCTLNSENLWNELAGLQPEGIALVGMLNTENLGIERLIQNTTADPNIRFLIVCGEDSRRRIGHLPGQSLVALGKNGLGERSRIRGAGGRRPVIRNIEPAMVEHFRRTVEIIDMIGDSSVGSILSAADSLMRKDPGPASTYQAKRTVPVETGYIPDRMISDPNGFFVIYPDRARGIISLEHFSNQGVLTTLIEGRSAAEVYNPAVEKKLLSRLDHACYLGRELARAELSLKTGEKYVQDAGPERSTAAASCGNSSGCH